MKKFLFLMLSLAVSASAFAGVNAQRIEKQAAPFTKDQVVKKNAPSFMKKSMQQRGIVNLPFVANVRMIDKSQLRAPVTERPEGTVKYYKRTSGTALFLGPNEETGSYDTYYAGDQDGYVMTVEDGNTVWFKNLVYNPTDYLPDYWIKGTKTNNRITISLPQEIANTSQWGNVVLGFGTTSVGDEGLEYTPGSSTVQYTLSGNNLSLQGTTVGTGQYAAYTGTGLSVYWEDDNDLIGMEWKTVMTVATDVPEEPTMYTDADIDAMTGGELAYYHRTGESFYYDVAGYHQGNQYNYAYIYFAADGSTVYMRNPVYGYQNNIWVKGTVSGNKITVPLGQYLNWTDEFIGVKTAWGEVTLTPTDSTTYIDFTQDKSVTECTYTIDGKTVTLDGTSEYVGLAIILDSAYVEIEDNWGRNLDYSTKYITYPETPVNLTVTPAATTAAVAWEDNDNDTWNVRYRVYKNLSAAYSNDFDESLEGWGSIDFDGDGNTWGWYGDDDGNGFLASFSYINGVGALTPDNWMISPEVTLNGGVSIDAWSYNANYPGDVFGIYVTTNLDFQSTDDWVQLGEDVATDGTKTTYNFNIPDDMQGQQGYVAIRHYNCTDFFVLAVDNFFVGDPDATPNPWINITGVTENPYTITGLTPETTYEVEVQGVNEGGYGEWSEIAMFTTLAQSSYLRGDVDGSGTVDITDATTLINYLLNGSANPFVEDNADVDFSGGIDISDATTLINFLLTGNWPN